MRAGIGGPEATSTADIWRHSATWWREHTPLAAIGPAPDLPLPADAAIGFAFPPAAEQRAHLPALLALAAYDHPAEVTGDLLDGELDRPDHPYLLVLPADRIQPRPARRHGLLQRGQRHRPDRRLQDREQEPAQGRPHRPRPALTRRSRTGSG